MTCRNSGYSFSPGLRHICMAALFQGSHKDRATDLQKVLDTLQSPNREELLCHVLANGQEQWASGRIPF